ncbi:MAG: aromatic acid exporter family protein [Acholeplasmataceae bacterium]
MRRLNTAIKMGLVALLASSFAHLLNLEYWLTAGLLALLSIQLTKRDSVRLAFLRLANATIGIALATLFFIVFGYHFSVFSAFVFIFAYLSWTFGMSAGIVPSLVLVTHLLTEGEFSEALIVNEFALIGVALAIALPFNTFYPSFAEREMKRFISRFDTLLKDHLYVLVLVLRDGEMAEEFRTHYRLINQRIQRMMDEAKLVDSDILFDNDHRYLNYLSMRKDQIKTVNDMYDLAERIHEEHAHTAEIALFIERIIGLIGTTDRATPARRELEKMKNEYRQRELPQTRSEFETRATLYQIIHELERFLEIKIAYHEDYPKLE